jgi:hypothetical protein
VARAARITYGLCEVGHDVVYQRFCVCSEHDVCVLVFFAHLEMTSGRNAESERKAQNIIPPVVSFQFIP